MRWPWSRPLALPPPDPHRLDAAAEAAVRATSSPAFHRHLDAVTSLWGSTLTGVGGSTDPLSYVTVQGFQPLDDYALAQLSGDPVAARGCAEIPEAIAAAGHSLTLPDGGKDLADLPSILSMDEHFREADRLSRQYRGAGILIRVREVGNPPLSAPMDPHRVQRIIGLDVYDGYQLVPETWQTGGERDHHPLFDLDAHAGDPLTYKLNPTGWTGGYREPVHWTRIIPFWGQRVAPGPAAYLFLQGSWRSLSTLDLAYQALRRYSSTQRNGERIAGSTGVFVGEVENYNALQTGKDAEGSSGGGWMSFFRAALARFGMIVGPPGTKITASAIPLSGWADLENGALVAIAGATRTPVAKLFSTPPPGLSTDSTSWRDQWEDVTRADHAQRWRPGQARLYRLEYWRRNRKIPAWMRIERGPLKALTPAEEMALRVQGATEVATLYGAGVDVSSAVLEGRYGADGWNVDLPPVRGATSTDPTTSAEAPAGGEVVADLALNGAQVEALLSILERVAAGQLSQDGAVTVITTALPLVAPTAARGMVEGVQIGQAGTVDPNAPQPAPIAPVAPTLQQSDDLPADTSAADFAAAMTAAGAIACEHGRSNRCPLCRIERVREVVPGPDGPTWPVRWRAIRSDAMPPDAVPLGPPPTPNREPYPYTGSLVLHGLPILIETAAGQARSGIDPEGRAWTVTMPWHYGEIAGTMGLDGDPVDIMVGPNPEAPNAYIIHLRVPGAELAEEDKVYLGFDSPEDALAAFRDAYTRRDLLAGYTRWHLPEFLAWIQDPANRGKRIDTPPGSGLADRTA